MPFPEAKMSFWWKYKYYKAHKPAFQRKIFLYTQRAAINTYFQEASNSIDDQYVSVVLISFIVCPNLQAKVTARQSYKHVCFSQELHQFSSASLFFRLWLWNQMASWSPHFVSKNESGNHPVVCYSGFLLLRPSGVPQWKWKLQEAQILLDSQKDF